MARKGTLGIVTTSWARHLKPFGKRQAAKQERLQGRRYMRDEVSKGQS